MEPTTECCVLALSHMTLGGSWLALMTIVAKSIINVDICLLFSFELHHKQGLIQKCQFTNQNCKRLIAVVLGFSINLKTKLTKEYSCIRHIFNIIPEIKMIGCSSSLWHRCPAGRGSHWGTLNKLISPQMKLPSLSMNSLTSTDEFQQAVISLCHT